MMVKLSREQLDKGVICSSAGNHAQGVALAAKKLGCDAVIVMPVTTPEIKVSFSLNTIIFFGYFPSFGVHFTFLVFFFFF